MLELSNNNNLNNLLTNSVNSGVISQLYKEYVLTVSNVSEHCSDLECLIRTFEGLRSSILGSELILEEKKVLVASISLVLDIANVKYCDFTLISTRTDDGFYCTPGGGVTLSDGCGVVTLVGGAVVGAVAGFIIGSYIVSVAPPLAGALPIFVIGGAIVGVVVANFWNPLDCNSSVCDDCLHPETLVPILNYEDCRFTSVQAFGAFEFAENWEWFLQSVDGLSSFSETTDVPRVEIPENFNLAQSDFNVSCLTLCDGGEYPPLGGLINTNTGQAEEQDITPTNILVSFSNYTPSLSVIGESVFFPNDPITYLYESTVAGGELSNPVWSVDDAEIIDQGKQFGKYFIEVSFFEIQEEFQTVRLTLFDDCTQNTSTRSLNVYRAL